jgi:hypothetical protein
MQHIPRPGLAIDQIEGTLRAISNDHDALSRLAVISVLTTHGERTWTSDPNPRIVPLS